MTEQRWLTLDMISSTLRVPKGYIYTLTKNGHLVSIGHADKRRWLDPTPEYAEKLFLAAVLHRETNYVPHDVSEIALLTLREVAVICGWTLGYARLYMQRHPKTPHLRINSQMYLYTVSTIREILWRRQKRKLAPQRSPFLIQKLIDFFWRQLAEDEKGIPTDEEYRKDDEIQRKLEVMTRRFNKAEAQQDFASKIELARRVVQILEFAKSLPGDAPPEPRSPLPVDTEPR